MTGENWVPVDTKRLDNWKVIPNLWGCIVAPPGHLKSPALAAVMRPLHRLQTDAFALHDMAMARYTEELAEVEQRNKAIQARNQNALKRDANYQVEPPLPLPVEPQPGRFIVNNFNMESLAEVFISSPHGTLLFLDELHGLFGMLDKLGNESLHDFLLECWNGDGSFTLDRITRGVRHVESMCMSVLGGIQPGRLAEHIAGVMAQGSGDSGLLQRFQVAVLPDFDEKWQLVDREPDRAAEDAVVAMLQRFLSPSFGSPGHPETRHFDDDAQERFFEWLEGLETSLRDHKLPAHMESHMAKYRSLIPSLALLFAIADGHAGDVALSHLEQAIEWGEFLRKHAERLYFNVAEPGVGAAYLLLEKIEAGDLSDGFTLRDVQRHCWKGLSRESAEAGILTLINAGVLQEVDVPTTPAGGRPKTILRIRPDWLKGVSNS